MPTIETLQPGKNLGAKALLVTSLLDAGVPIRKAAKAAGVSKGTAEKLTPSKRKDKTYDHIDSEQVQRVRSTFQDRCLLLSDGLLGTNLYSKAGKAGLGETVQAAYKLAELAGIKQPDRTEHFHAVMLKFSQEPPENTVLINQGNSDGQKESGDHNHTVNSVLCEESST